MLYFFGAWSQMELLIHLVYMVSCIFIIIFYSQMFMLVSRVWTLNLLVCISSVYLATIETKIYKPISACDILQVLVLWSRVISGHVPNGCESENLYSFTVTITPQCLFDNVVHFS
jgi:hypothetical protein